MYLHTIKNAGNCQCLWSNLSERRVSAFHAFFGKIRRCNPVLWTPSSFALDIAVILQAEFYRQSGTLKYFLY
jgi:hypothetical protein